MAEPRYIRPADDRRLTKTIQKSTKRLHRILMQIAIREHEAEAMSLFVPEEWSMLDFDMPEQPKKVRMTLLVDAPVARFYRARGRGYQAFVNEVLKLYAELRIAKVIEGVEDRAVGGKAI